MHPDNHPPDNPTQFDANQFDAWLDAFVAGPSTPAAVEPEPASPDLAAAQSAARQVHELADVAATAHASPPPSTASWEEILMSTVATTPTTVPPSPVPIGAHHRTRTRRMETVNRILSIAAVLAILIAGASTAWLNRSHLGFGGGGDEPHSYLAAITLPSGQEVNITYTVPTKEDCTVTPLTVDQVMTRLQTRTNPIPPKASPPSEAESATMATPSSAFPKGNNSEMTQETFDTLKANQVEWLACSLYGSPFQRWALESNEMVQQEFQAAYMPVFDIAAIRADLEKLANGEEVSHFTAPVLTPDGYLPMVIDARVGYYTVMSYDDKASISILWMRADGQRLQPFGTTAEDPNLQPYIKASRVEQSLPNVWTFRLNKATGDWLLDSLTVGMG